MAGITIWVFAFFRDPVRAVPQDVRAIIAPADGLVTLIQKVPPPPELAGPDKLGEAPMTRVSIFHERVRRSHQSCPDRGYGEGCGLCQRQVPERRSRQGEGEDNERQHFLIERADGVRIGFTQIAGLVARRIVPFVKQGDIIAAGQRVGLIRFGSRVDVYLPAGTAPKVMLGTHAVAGETVLAILGDDVAAGGVLQ